MNGRVIQGYTDDASDLIPRYEAVSSSDLFAPFAGFLPDPPGRLIDIGSGTGRDAAWFAGKGFDVLAVEPVAPFRKAGATLHRSHRIEWLDDRLPALTRVLDRGERFDVVLLSAVWQHLNTDQRALSMATIRTLTAPTGVAVVSLRHGPGAPTRPVLAAPADEALYLAGANGFDVTFTKTVDSLQAENRAAGVTWTFLAFSPSPVGAQKQPS